MTIQHIEDIWNESRIDPFHLLEEIHIYSCNEENKNCELGLNANKMEEIKTRPIYPADRRTFAIKNEEKQDKIIRNLNFHFRPRRDYNLNVILEDKKRNEMSYI